jgi:IS5 family transposase
MALPGNPYDGHTLGTVIPAMEDTIGAEIERILADAGYRGHNAPQSHRFRVFTARSVACRRPSNARCDDDPRSSR